MAPNIVASATSGMLFGAALSAAGVASPSVILQQLRLEDFHMLEVFLTATASSALIILITKRTKLSQCSPRCPTTWNWFSKYDGNIIGCLLLGSGMALTGSCPGTVMVQLGMGLRSALDVLAGSLLGGIAYVGLAPYLKCTAPSPPTQENGAASREKEKEKEKTKTNLALYESLGLSEVAGVIGFDAFCVATVLTVLHLFPSPDSKLLHPLIGGLLMGASQLSSILLTGNTLGVSTAYETFGTIFWRGYTAIFGPSVLGPKNIKAAPFPALNAVLFAAGVASGSALFWKFSGTPIPISTFVISQRRNFLGGLLMAFGARFAGGCTSGHGISGMAGLSNASFISVAAMFGGGIALSLVLKALE